MGYGDRFPWSGMIKKMDSHHARVSGHGVFKDVFVLGGILYLQASSQTRDIFHARFKSYIQDSLGIPKDSLLEGIPRDSLGIPQGFLGIPWDSFGIPQGFLGIPWDSFGIP